MNDTPEVPTPDPLSETALERFFKRQDRRDRDPKRIWCGDCGVGVSVAPGWAAIDHEDHCLHTSICALQAEATRLREALEGWQDLLEDGPVNCGDNEASEHWEKVQAILSSTASKGK